MDLKNQNKKQNLQIPFQKYHGLGNHFIIINNIDNILDKINPKKFKEFIIYICHPRFGIGADCLLVVSNKQVQKESYQQGEFDIQYNIYNLDGFEAQTCGNGLRCFVKYLLENQIFDKKQIYIKTMKKIQLCEAINEDQFKINMGKVELECQQIPARIKKFQENQYIINERISFINYELQTEESFQITLVNTSNPHCIIQVDDIQNTDVQRIGKLIQSNTEIFPEGINVGFYQVKSRSEITYRVYERGCGETEACGSGACATVVAGNLCNILDNSVLVHLDGGDLLIDFENKSQIVHMQGPATKVYTGIMDVPQKFCADIE